MASYARRFVAAGVRLVGGCCGTTPEHIRQIAEAVRADGARARGRRRAPRPTGGRSVRPSRAARSRRWPRRSPTAASSSSRRSRRRAALDLAASVAAGAAFRDRWRGRRQRAGLPAVGRARERAGARGADRERRGRDAAALLLPRSHADRHAVGPGRRARDGHCATCCSRRAARRASASYADATSVFDVDAIGLTNMVDAAEPGARHRRPADRRADAVPRRRRRQSVCARSGGRVAPARRTRSRPAPSSSSRRRFSTSTAFEPALARLQETGLPVLAGARRARGLAPRGVPRERGGRRAGRRYACWTACDGTDDQAAEAMAITLEIAAWLRQRVDGLQVTSVHGSPRRPNGC